MLLNKRFLSFAFLFFVLCAGARTGLSNKAGYCAASFAQEFVYDSKGKRDPFIPLVTPEGRLLKLDKQEPSPGALTIEGIIYDKHGRSFAIVNTAVVGIGDLAGDYQVLKIQEDKVIFIKDGIPLEVELIKEGAK